MSMTLRHGYEIAPDCETLRYGEVPERVEVGIDARRAIEDMAFVTTSGLTGSEPAGEREKTKPSAGRVSPRLVG